MITPKELRIGNLIYSKLHKMPTEVYAIFANSVKLSANPLAYYDLTEIEPIALTEEILLNSGFVCRNEKGNKRFIKSGFMLDVKGSCFFEHWYARCLPAVHDLQNFYSVVVLKELEIKF